MHSVSIIIVFLKVCFLRLFFSANKLVYGLTNTSYIASNPKFSRKSQPCRNHHPVVKLFLANGPLEPPPSTTSWLLLRLESSAWKYEPQRIMLI